MTVSRATASHFVPGSSRGPRNVRTLALQMAMEKERQLEVAERIRALRGPKPQPVVADEVGVGLRAYQHWEAGGGISWENLQRLAQVFGVSEDFLLYGSGEAKGPETQLDRMERQLGRIVDLLAEQEIAKAPPPRRKRGSGPAKAVGE